MARQATTRGADGRHRSGTSASPGFRLHSYPHRRIPISAPPSFEKTEPNFSFIECSRNFLTAFCKTRRVDDRSESGAAFYRADALDPGKRAQTRAKSWRQPKLLAVNMEMR